MIERVVENWLTNTNEIGYQIPFAQYLLSENYQVLHLSKHGQMEQGKDIISIDNNGKTCVFQLKGGNIGLTEWRKIKGEIDELIEVPIHYPGIDKKIADRAVLVTNGVISDPVRRTIDDLNPVYKQRGFTQLELITKMDLLKRFLTMHGTFLPSEPTEFKQFLELYYSDERALIDKEAYAHFVESILFSSKETKPELNRKIASGLLLNQYILTKYFRSENNLSIAEGCTLFGSYILALVEKYNLEEKYWRASFNLILKLIIESLDSLKSEFLKRTEYLEDSWDGGLIYKSRMTIVLGWLSAFELYRKSVDASYSLDELILKKIKSYREYLWYWGESATGYFITMSMLAEKLGDSSLSTNILIDLVAKIGVENGSKDGKGFPNSYYSAEEVIGYSYKIEERELDSESFLGQSYHIGAIVDMLTRRNKRRELDELWNLISKLMITEFKPSSKWQFLFWQTDEGEQVQHFYDHPQSWGDLRTKAKDVTNVDLPLSLQKNPFSYFFLLTYPHRITRESVKQIDF